jgi:hypothetical protein
LKKYVIKDNFIEDNEKYSASQKLPVQGICDNCFPINGPLPAHGEYPEMEFLDINLTKDASPFLHAVHCPYYWRIGKKLFFGFKNPYKKIRITRKIELIHE